MAEARPAGDPGFRHIVSHGRRGAAIGLGFVTITVASGTSWTDIVTTIGTVLAGLALPLAFFQLGVLRQDRLRAQVSKVGIWTGASDQAGEERGSWTVPVFIRNGSELPVRVDTVDLAAQAWGYERVLAAPEGTTEVDYYMDRRVGESGKTYIAPGTIAPGDAWSTDWASEPEIIFDQLQPKASITRVVITDAAGYQWEVRSGKVGPARRVRRWQRWWWNYHGHL
jgi:hypothetical protein